MRSDYLLIKPLHQAISQVKKFVLLFVFLLIGWSSWAQVANQATNIVVTGKTQTSLTFNWTNGTGTRRIVVVKEIGGAFTPVDGISYSNNSDFSSVGNPDLDPGAPVVKSVFDGINGPVTVSGLASGTSYIIQVYDFTIPVLPPIYNTSNGAINNPLTTSTLTTEPGADPSGLAFSNVAGRSLTLSWNAIGTPPNSGTERIVIVNANAVSSVGPVDGITYTANPAFGSINETVAGNSNYVVYKGIGTSVNITNLTANTNYKFSVVAFNGSGGSENYRGSGTQQDRITSPFISNVAFSTPAANTPIKIGTATVTISVDSDFGNAHTLQSGTVAGYPLTNFTRTNNTTYTADITIVNGGTDIPAGNNLPVANLVLRNSNSIDNPAYSQNIIQPNDPLDANRPTLSIGAPSAVLVKNSSSATYTITYSGEDNITLANGNITINQGTGANATPDVTGAGSTRTVTLTNFTGNGTVGISIAAGTGADAAGNLTLAAGPSATITVDTQAPTNQNTVFPASIGVVPGGTVTIVTSGTASNEVWFAPSGTTTFVAGATMTKAANGTATSILAPATAGDYKLFVLDAIGNISNESTATLAVFSPQATNLTFAAASSDAADQINFNWTNGGGDGRIVIMKTQGAVYNLPAGALTADLDFTNGTDLNGGTAGTVRCVFIGTGSGPIEVFGLSGATTYTIEVYEYKGANIYLKPALTADRSTINGTSPTDPAAAMAFTNITNNSITVQFTQGAGSSGTASMLVAREGAAVSFTPVDGVSYSANPDYSLGNDLGSGNKVIAHRLDANAGTAIIISGLNPDVVYHFAVVNFNGAAGTGAENYGTLVADVLLGNRNTEPSTLSSGFIFTPAETSLTLDWTGNNGNGDGRVVVMRSGSAVVTDPVDYTNYTANNNFGFGAPPTASAIGAGYLVYDGTGSSVTINNLFPSTTYHFAVYEYNNTTSQGAPNKVYGAGAATSQATTADVTAPVPPNPVGSLTTVGGTVVTGYWNSTNTQLQVVVPLPTNDGSLDGGSVQVRLRMTGGAFANIPGSGVSTITNGQRVAGTKTVTINAADLENVATGFTEGNVSGATGSETKFLIIGARISDLAGNPSADYTQSATQLDVDQSPPTIIAAAFNADFDPISEDPGFTTCDGTAISNTTIREYVHLTISEPLNLANGALVPIGSPGFAASAGTFDVTCDSRGASVYHNSNTIHLLNNFVSTSPNVDGGWTSGTTFSFTSGGTIIKDLAGNEMATIPTISTVAAPPALASGMVLDPNGSNPEIITFVIDQVLLTSTSANAVTGITVDADGPGLGAAVSRPGTYNNVNNTVTVTSTADGQWTSATTVSYTSGTATPLTTTAAMASFGPERILLGPIAIISNNSNSSAWAREGNTITITITANPGSLPLSGTPFSAATIAGIDVLPSLTGSNPYTFSLVTSALTAVPETLVAFSITAEQTGRTTTVTKTIPGTSVTYDKTAPAAPLALDLDAPDDNGLSNSDNITSLNTGFGGLGLTFTGTAEVNSTVSLYDGTNPVPIGSAGTNGAGVWTITVPSLSEGFHNLTAKSKDFAANESPASAILKVKIDTQAPSTLIESIVITPPPVPNAFGTNGVDSSPTAATQPLTFTVKFKEQVFNVQPANFYAFLDGGASITSGPITVVAVNDSIYTVTITNARGTGRVTLGFVYAPILLPVVSDLAGNVATGANMTGAFTGNSYYSLVLPNPDVSLGQFVVNTIDNSYLDGHVRHSGAWTNQEATHFLIMARELNGGTAFPPISNGNYLPDDITDANQDGLYILNKLRTGGNAFNEPFSFSPLKSGVSYTLIVYPYTLQTNYANSNIHFGNPLSIPIATTPVSTNGGISTISSGPGTIPSTVTTANGLEVFTFMVTDGTQTGLGGGENAPTKIKSITINEVAGIDNVVNWSTVIAGAQLYDVASPSTFVTASSITGNQIVFTGIASSLASDIGYIAPSVFGGSTSSKTYGLRIFLNGTSGALYNEDGKVLAFRAAVALTDYDNDDDSLPTAEHQASSQVGPGLFANSGSVVIDIAATKLVYTTNLPDKVGVKHPFAIAPVVEALDANNNLDINFTGETIATNPPAITFSTTNTFINGKLTLSNFVFNDPGLVKIVVSKTGVTSATSASPTGPGGNTNVVVSAYTSVAQGAAPSATISSLITFAPGAIPTAGQQNASALSNFNFIVTDDNSVPAADDDILPTRISTITIKRNDVNNGSATGGATFDDWQNSIAGAELHVGGLSVGGTVTRNANSIVFSGIANSVTGAPGFIDDGTSKTYTLKIWLQNPVNTALRDIFDGEDFVFEFTNVSDFVLTSATGNYSSTLSTLTPFNSGNGNNTVEVIATRLDFTTQPPATQNYDAVLTATPVVKARDANQNLDRGYSSNATLSTVFVPTVSNPTPHVYPLSATAFAFSTGQVSLAAVTVGSAGLGINNDVIQLKLDDTPDNVTVSSGLSSNIILTFSGESDIIKDPLFITSGTAGNTYTSNIQTINNREAVSLNFTAANSIALERFVLRDGGSDLTDTDGSKTKLASITVNVENYQYIRRIGIFDGAIKIQDLDSLSFSGTGDVTFNGITTFEANDNNSKALTVRVSFKAKNILDNQQIRVRVVSATAGGVSSQISASSTAFFNPGSVGINDNRIEVVATKIDFTTIPATASVSVPFAVQVSARDIYGNLDADYNGTISAVSNTISASFNTINNPGITSPAGDFALGIKSYPPGFQFDLGNGDVKLTIESGPGLTPGSVHSATVPLLGTSPTISVISSFDSRIAPDPTFTHQADVNYINHQEAGNITATNTSFEITRFILHDGDPAMPYPGAQKDLDGAPTILENLDVELFTGASLLPIRRIAIYADGVEVTATDKVPTALASGKSTTSFNGVNITVPDEGQVAISIRVSFLNNAADILDNDPITVRISGATNLPGSKFIPTSGFIAGVNGGLQTPVGVNKVEVTATRLDFTQQAVLTPFIAGINVPIAQPVVQARDIYQIVDRDYNSANPDPNYQRAGIQTYNTGSAVSLAPLNFSSFNFANGVLNFAGLQYTNFAGEGSLMVTTPTGLSSNTNGSVPGNHIDVIHTMGTKTEAGIFSSNNLIGGSQSRVIFGVTFGSTYTIAGQPKLEKFKISFSKPINGVLTNLKIFESTTSTYISGSAVNVEQQGFADLTVLNDSLIVDFTTGTPRDLSGGPLSYFLMVDVDPSANAGTPKVRPFIEDTGVATDINVDTEYGSQFVNGSNWTKEYSFAAILAPTLTKSYPASGQLNVDPTQDALELVFSAPVWTHDGEVKLFRKSQKTDVDTFVATLNATNGFYNKELGVLAGSENPPYQPMKFSIPASTLQIDSLYYVTINKGEFIDSLSVDNKGVMDEGKNLFGGITYPYSLYFKASNNRAPKLLSTADATVPEDPAITYITPTSATLKGIFDQQGKAFYMVVPANARRPTVDQIKRTDLTYPTVVSFGSFDIVSTKTISQFGLITGLNPNTTYDVWVCAESYKWKKSGAIETLTPIPTLFPYDNKVNGFGVNAVSGGATLTFTTLATSPITTAMTTIVPSITICANSFQILNSPIVIAERNANAFNGPNGLVTLNLLAPSGFLFDRTGNEVVTVSSVTISSGLDIDPGSGQITFLNNTIAKITFKNNGTGGLSLDMIAISGLKVIANTSTDRTGFIVRFGGNAIPNLADETHLARLSTFAADPVEFTNSYSVDVYNNNLVTFIPDNYNRVSGSSIELLPLPAIGDFGTNTFSGPGVNVNELSLTAVTVGSPFNITLTHKDNNGCISQNSVQYTVYDHTKAIPALATEYCITNTAFPAAAPSGSVHAIPYRTLTGYYLMDLQAAPLPESNNIKGPEWTQVIKLLPKQGASATDPDFAGKLFYNFSFDDAGLLNASTIVSGARDPYDFFKSPIPSPQKNFYYEGGSLGTIKFTATYQSRANSDLILPLEQNIEFFIPAIPIVETGLTNRTFLDENDLLNPKGSPGPVVGDHNKGTPIYCEFGGIIEINAYPRADNALKRLFKLVDAANGTVIYDPQIPGTPPDGFVDNKNGNATLDPTKIKNGYKDIKIIYIYKDNLSPANCESTGYQIIRISPNPVAMFTVASDLSAFVDNTKGLSSGKASALNSYCEKIPITFDPASSSIAADQFAFYVWDFGDLNSATNIDTTYAGAASKIVNIYPTIGTYRPKITAVSDKGCRSLNTNNNFVDVTVGAIPVVNFDVLGTSTADQIVYMDKSTVPGNGTNSFSNIATMTWNYGSQISIPGHYTITGIATTAIGPTASTINAPGCSRSFDRHIVILDKKSGSFEDDFESLSKSWQTMKDSLDASGQPLTTTSVLPSSWRRGKPASTRLAINSTPITSSTNNNVWATGLTGLFLKNERSFFYSPSFDITGLVRPMISFDANWDMIKNGVVLEYSVDNKNVADPTKVWSTVGNNLTGVNWFNEQIIGAKPGEQTSGDFGWSGSSGGWVKSKHELSASIVGIRSNVVFRFGFASINDGGEGFALDNFRIGERTRIVLLESFANTGNAAAEEKTQNDAVAAFNAGSVGTDVIKLNYHTSFPGSDPFNQNNPADPSSRALYYEVAKTPSSVLDGLDSTAVWTQWGPNKFNTQTLELAGAEINIAPPVIDAAKGISVSISVDAISAPIPKDKTILFVAVVEQSVAKTALTSAQSTMVKSGETNFEYVVKKLLPSAAGTKLTTNIVKGTPQTFNFEWAPDLSKFYTPNTGNLAIVAFLQDELTRKVYQTKMVANLNDPPLITGIEMLLPEQINVYPNPANKEFVVELPGIAQNDISLRMVDQVGRMHESGMISSGKSSASVSVEQFAEGIYILVIGSEKTGVVRKKVMVVRKN